MPEPTARLRGIQPYVFATLIARKRALEAEGVRVLDLSLGSPDQPMPEGLIAAVAEAVQDRRAHGYPVMSGELALLTAFADFMQRRFGVTLDPRTEVVPTAGAKEALAHLVLAYCEPGDAMLITDVAYPVYERAVAASGADLVLLPVTADSQWWPDLSAIDAATARRAKFLLLNFPNNPVGAVATRAQWAEAVDFCRAHDIILISDLAYSELVQHGEAAPSVFEVAGAREVAIEIHSGSKNFSMAGLRLGMVAGRADVCGALNAYRTLVGYGVPTIVQRAGTYAFTHAEALAAELREGYRARFDAAVAGFAEGGLHVAPPPAGMYLWIPVPAGMTDWDVQRRLLDEERIMVTPGSGFGPGGAGYVRLSMVAAPDVLRDAGHRAARIWREAR
ncbi:MAG TPA: aminotransferase class I/II-fold pyridoxal phosphate-dependent enzyme [Gemmatimonadales bacterium]|nr:aminotransferase class I/II-fold pyridoxal phosphate-dependent enzyme [Gemmatimonadales bacterium]